MGCRKGDFLAPEEVSKSRYQVGEGTEILERIFTLGSDLFLDAKIVGLMKRSTGYVHSLLKEH